MADDTTRKVQLLELMIALEVRRICEMRGIPYFLMGGTCLGAVRHGGFIPWDDDMDIGMLRADYERFLAACETDLDDKYFLQTWDTDPAFALSYAKIRLNGTHFVEEFSEGVAVHDGIFVDIFPYDSAPDDEREAARQARRYFFYKRLLWMKQGYGRSIRRESLKQRLKYDAFSLVSRFFNYERARARFKEILLMYDGEETARVTHDGTSSYERQAIPRAWARDLSPVSFEGESFLTFSDPERFLSFTYGDFMTLPPESERGGHSALSVDFGEWA